MAKTNGNVVEINGKKYDATTGRPLPSVAAQKPVAKAGGARVIDGFRAPMQQPAGKRSVQQASIMHASKQKATTLRRNPAQKPHAAPKVQKSAVASKLQSDNTPAIVPKASTHHASPNPTRNANLTGKSKSEQLSERTTNERLERAQTKKRSSRISKFSRKNSVSEEPSVAAELVEAPITSTPVASAPAEEPIAPAEPFIISADQQQRQDEARAIAKTQKKRRLRSIFANKPKLVPVAATVGCLLLIGGYVTYLNIPNMALRVAASRAGFDASLPAYKPSGFSFSGPIAYSPGQITVQFDSNSDDREFRITEKESPWDSQSLLDNFVSRETSKYVTFQERGLTVYVYNGSNATWVDGGVWYTIEGDSLLNSDQLLKIASSL